MKSIALMGGTGGQLGLAEPVDLDLVLALGEFEVEGVELIRQFLGRFPLLDAYFAAVEDLDFVD